MWLRVAVEGRGQQCNIFSLPSSSLETGRSGNERNGRRIKGKREGRREVEVGRKVIKYGKGLKVEGILYKGNQNEPEGSKYCDFVSMVNGSGGIQ